jgi:hypothetical protein
LVLLFLEKLFIFLTTCSGKSLFPASAIPAFVDLDPYQKLSELFPGLGLTAIGEKHSRSRKMNSVVLTHGKCSDG